MVTMLPFRSGHDTRTPPASRMSWNTSRVAAAAGFNSLLTRVTTADEEEMTDLPAISAGSRDKLRRFKSGTRSISFPKTHRGVWADADFQLYINRFDPFSRSGDMTDWAQFGFKSARHFSANRLSESAERYPDVLTSVQIFNADDSSYSKLIEMKNSLKRLDAHKCGILEWPISVIEQLRHLERLNLSCNALNESSFPATLELNNLVEVNLNSNSFTVIPPGLYTLKRLHRLYMGYNDISTVKHIDQIRSLTCIDLECNNIETVPWYLISTSLKHLEVLNLSSNQIIVLDKNVKYFRDLVELNLSHNQLSLLPIELFQIKTLKSLDLSYNKLQRLPQVNLQQMSPDIMDLIDLSYNQIYKFCEWLLFIAITVDMTGNVIQTLSGHSLKHMHHHTKQRLILRENPVNNPPPDVCNAGLPAIIKYFQEIKTNASIYQGIKVVVIGSKGCGKTSLIQSWADGQTRMAFADETTKMASIAGIESSITVLQAEKQFKMTVLDTSGDPFYLNTLHHFLDPNALYIHVFNLATYRTGDFQVNFADWLHYVIAKNNDIKLLIVGTHADQLQSDTVKRICEEVNQMVTNFFNSFKDKIKRKIAAIETMDQIGAYMQDQLKHYVHTLMNVSVYQYSKVLPISNTEFTGFEKIQTAVNSMIGNQKYFSLALRQIPSLWVGVHDTLETLSANTQVPIMHIDDLKEELISAHGMKNMMTDICTYLHDTGSIIWLKYNSKLKDFVFLRPRWLLDIIKAIIRPDIEKLEFEELEDLLLPRGIIRPRFNQMRDDVSEFGCYESEFLRMILSRHLSPNSPKTGLFLQIFSSMFEYGYPVDKNNSDFLEGYMLTSNYKFPGTLGKPRRPQSAMSTMFDRQTDSNNSYQTLNTHFSIDQTELDLESENFSKVSKTSDGKASTKTGSVSGGDNDIPSLLISCLRRTQEPSIVSEKMEDLQQKKFYKLNAVFVFPIYLPPGFLYRLFVRYNHPDHQLKCESHWNTGLYARQRKASISLFVHHWVESTKNPSGETSTESYIKLTAHNEKHIELKAVQETWAFFLPFILDMEALIQDYKGLRAERYVNCPNCNSMSFNGEWTAPKDMQQTPSVRCKTCEQEVKTDLLIQPREKKAADQLFRVIVELNRRRTMRARMESADRKEVQASRVMSAFAGPRKLGGFGAVKAPTTVIHEETAKQLRT